MLESYHIGIEPIQKEPPVLKPTEPKKQLELVAEHPELIIALHNCKIPLTSRIDTNTLSKWIEHQQTFIDKLHSWLVSVELYITDSTKE